MKIAVAVFVALTIIAVVQARSSTNYDNDALATYGESKSGGRKGQGTSDTSSAMESGGKENSSNSKGSYGDSSSEGDGNGNKNKGKARNHVKSKGSKGADEKGEVETYDDIGARNGT